MPAQLSFFVFLLTLSLLGCASDRKFDPKKPLTNDSALSTIPLTPAPNKEKAATFAKEAKVGCPPGAKCTPSVGLLSFTGTNKKGWGVAQCSASLVAEDIVLTTGECIPHDLRKAGASCAGRIWVAFPEDSEHPNYETRADCEKVLHAQVGGYVHGFNAPEYAFLKLSKKTGRPSFRLSREGIKDGKAYWIHRVQPRKDGTLSGEVETVSCKAVHNSAIFPKVNHSKNGVALLADCKLVEGSFGSPVLASDGSLRAVTISPQNPAYYQSIMKKKGYLQAEELKAPLNLVANLACLKAPEEIAREALPADCSSLESSLEEITEKYQAQWSAQIRAQAEAQILSAQKHNSLLASFHFTLEKKIVDGPRNAYGRKIPIEVWEAQPTCLQPAAAETLLNKPFALTLPRFRKITSYDRYFRLSHKLEEMAPRANLLAQIYIDGESGQYQLKTQVGSETPETKTIFICPKQ